MVNRHAPATADVSRSSALPGPELASRQLRALRLGVAGIVLAFLVLAALHTITIPAFLAADETPHTGYALLLSRGVLPTLDTPTPLHEIPDMPQAFVSRRRVYTANHPPLYYALVAVPLRLGVETGSPTVGFYAARLLGVGLAAAGLVAAAILARLLAPGRPQLALAAAGIGGLLPSFVHISALVHNDGLGFTTTTFALALSVLVLAKGPTNARLLWLALAAAAAAGTRSSGLLVVTLVVLGALGGAILHLKRPPRARIAWGIAHGALVAVATAILSGWFYLRNFKLYGDLTGTAANLDRFGYEPRGSTHEFLLSLKFLGAMYDQLWGRFAALQFLAKGRLGLLTDVIGLLILLGLFTAAARWLRGAPRRDVPSLLTGWMLALLLPVLLLVLLADYVARGGGAHARYLYPALAVFALVAGLGLDQLPGRRRGFPILGMFAGQVALNIVFWGNFLSRINPGRPAITVAIERRIDDIALPVGLTLTVIAALLTLSVAIVGHALWVLGEQSGAGPAHEEIEKGSFSLDGSAKPTARIIPD
jgi:hypothetical protein